jgi:rhodanese-related sulfurtransferase
MKMQDTDHGPVEAWTPQEVSEAFEKGEVVLIDVRTPQEFALERIGGALLAPMQAFQPAHLPDQHHKRIVLHCGSGMRSGKVAALALSAGIERIAHMEGGFAAWKAAGLPYTGTDVATGAPREMSDKPS